MSFFMAIHLQKKEVIIKTGWNKHPYTTSPDKEGNWKIEVPTPSAGGPYEIIISDGGGAHTAKYSDWRNMVVYRRM